MPRSTPMQFATAQLNCMVGDIAGNVERILKAYEQVKEQGADLLLCPELCVVGYPPEDLVLVPSFRKEAMRAVKELAKQTRSGPALLVGSVWEEKGEVFNAALLLDGGKILHVQRKIALPNYGIFDEKRIFSAGDTLKPVKWRGMKLGLLVCEDLWTENLASHLKKQGAEMLLVINASPFEIGKLALRKKVAARAVRATGLPLVYANMVGGQDDIVFDGGSFAMDAQGKVVAQLAEFDEELAMVKRTKRHAVMSTQEALWRAMGLGLRDYMEKNRFSGVVLGLSGGIDSAVTAALAVDALGAGRVKGVLLPSPYTSAHSVEDALESARLLGIETMQVPITPGMEMFDEVLSPVFHGADWMKEVAIGGNLQARLRGVTLMAISNKFGWLVLSTANKSEIAVGYSTLYGDSCGGYNVLKDLYKTQIYALAEWRNGGTGRGERGAGKAEFSSATRDPRPATRVIPQRSISKAPSAELAPGQKDSDQLPPYNVLDKILTLHLEGRLSVAEIVAKGYDKKTVQRVVTLVRQSEYKRRQSCPGVKLSPLLFGRDRRFPLTNGWKG